VGSRVCALQSDRRVAVLCLQLFHRGLAGIDLGLKRWLFDLVEEIVLLTSAPSTKSRFFEKPVTRATSATRFTAGMRPMKQLLSVICSRSAGTTPRRVACLAQACQSIDSLGAALTWSDIAVATTNSGTSRAAGRGSADTSRPRRTFFSICAALPSLYVSWKLVEREEG